MVLCLAAIFFSHLKDKGVFSCCMSIPVLYMQQRCYVGIVQIVFFFFHRAGHPISCIHLSLSAPRVKMLERGGNQAFYIVIPLFFSTKAYASHLRSVIFSSWIKWSLWASRTIRVNLFCFLKFTLHVKKTTVVVPICACCLQGTLSTAVPAPLVCSWKMMAGRAKQVGTWLFSAVTVWVWFGFTASVLILEEVS